VDRNGGAFLALGFRPFYAVAAVFSVVAAGIWMGSYLLGWAWPRGEAALTWHAHEMIYGYAMAVIAGFLLTAVRNWTGVATLNGIPLLLLLLCWLAARLLVLAGDALPLLWTAVADCLFGVLLLVAVSYPVARVRQYRQIGILSKLLLLLLANLLFYAGMLGLFPAGVRAGLYSGVYLVVALILVMARRVLPFFIQNGVAPRAQVKNRTWLDIASLVLFLALWIVDVLWPDTAPVAALAAILCLMHALRLAGWHHPALWRVPLLWVLFLAYAALVTGFALKAAVFLFGLSPFPALHAFTYGGIGLFTLGMMTRVSLAHTGRSIHELPAVVTPMFTLLAAGAVVRVLLPLLDPAHYQMWITVALVLWIVPFVLYLVVFLPMLLRPRVDGMPG